MSRMLKCLVVVVALAGFLFVSVAVASEFYVVKGADGKSAVVDKKPADAKSVVQGPFKTKEEAEKAMAGSKAEGSAKKPPKLPDQGC